jgi:hypothetical protein
MTTHIHFPSEEYPDRVIEQFGDVIPNDVAVAECRVDIPGGGTIKGYALSNHVFVSSEKLWFGSRKSFVAEKPFFRAIPIGHAVPKKRETGSDLRDQAGFVGYCFEDARPILSSGDTRKTFVHYAFLPIKITMEDGTSEVGDIGFKQPNFGEATLVNGGPKIVVKSEFHGMCREWEESLALRIHTTSSYRWGSTHSDSFNRNNPLEVLLRHVGKSKLAESPDLWWKSYFDHNWTDRTVDDSGIKATMRKKGIKENLEWLAKENPVDHLFFLWLFDARTINKRKNNSLLATMLEKVGYDFNSFLKTLWEARVNASKTEWTDRYSSTLGNELKHFKWDDDKGRVTRIICLNLPGASDAVQEQDAKSDWTKRKGNGAQADGLGIDKASFPKLRAAVESGNIPLGVFHQVNKDPINVEFPIWEKALGRKDWSETIFAIAKDASRRTTYERDITPFLSFMFKLEKYLKRHTGGKTWTAVPRFVESQYDLEMNDDDDAKATVKRRSALTPVADNGTHVVTVPYVALAVSGARTQWCYSRHFHLFEEGFTDPVSGGIVVSDLESKLNGRDDYGLCYYTLTGTTTARGYPTFLIIFENLRSGPRVHFHRVRPQRSKNGVATPACQLVDACYQYMAGNVPASDVMAQQGDLLFIKCNNNPIAAGAKVANPETSNGFEFESHQFLSEESLCLFQSTAKTPQNRLGFLRADSTFRVEHPEHEHLIGLEAGWYEIRRCKSYENNPKAVWSRTID